MSREVAQRFDANLVAQRERVGFSQEELSFRAALHRTEIGLLERGARMPRIDTLVKLAGALGIEPGDLLAGIAWQPGGMVRGQFKPDADAML